MITGPTGVGKTWIACALAQKACREGYRALYLRLPKLLQELPIAKGDGTYIGRDRNAGYPAPLAQIPACATNALGSCLGFWRQSVELGSHVTKEWQARTAATARRTAPKTFCDVGCGAEAHATNTV